MTALRGLAAAATVALFVLALFAAGVMTLAPEDSKNVDLVYGAF